MIMAAYFVRTETAWTDVEAETLVDARRLARAALGGTWEFQIFARDRNGGLDEGVNLNSRAALGAEYVALVGYCPFEDEPNLTAKEVIALIDEVTEEAKAASFAAERGEL